MVIDRRILDDLSERAKSSPRLRMAYDLRNTEEENSQRMLNAIEPGTVVPIHRHWGSNEIVLCIRGHFIEILYNADGSIAEEIDMVPGGNIVNVPIGQWHNLRSLESGTVMMEAKHGKYEPVKEENILRTQR